MLWNSEKLRGVDEGPNEVFAAFAPCRSQAGGGSGAAEDGAGDTLFDFGGFRAEVIGPCDAPVGQVGIFVSGRGGGASSEAGAVSAFQLRGGFGRLCGSGRAVEQLQPEAVHE